MGCHRFGVGRDSTTKVRYGVLQSALPAEKVCKVQVRVAEARLQLDGALKTSVRIVESVLTRIDVPEVVVCSGKLRIEGDCLGNQRLRFIESARLERDHAKQMLGFDVVRDCGENLSVCSIGLLEPARLVMRDRA